MRLISPSAARPNFPSAAVGMLILFVAVAAIGCGGHGKAEKLHDQGALLLKNRRLYKAIEKFEEALALKPDQVKTLAFCAEAYLKTGKGGSAELAIKYAGKAVELDPERHQAYLTLGQAHLKLALEKAEVDRRGEVKLDQDELDKAGEIVRRLEKEQAGSIERMLLQGRIDYLSDRLDEAERVYRAALEHSPDNPTGRLGMIEVLVAKEAYDRAEALARQMLEGESPPNPKALDQLAWCMARQGRSNEAYAALEPYLGGENKTPEVSNYLTAGRILIGYLEELSREGGSEAGQANAMKPAAGNESQWDWALSRLADLGSAMKGIYPDLPESYFYRGVSYQLLDDLDRSIEHFRQASEKRPADKRLRMMLAGALMQRREFPSARQELKTLLRIIPADFDARVRLAQCHAAEGSYEQAMEYLKPLHREHSDNAMVLELIARVMLMSDERDEVDTGLRILSELAGPEGLGEAEEDYLLAHSALREALSLIERNLQRQAEEKLLTAERLFENVARARPDEAGVQLKLGQLAQRRGDLFSALSYASRAAGIDPENRPFMARVLVRLGQFEAAGRIYDQILKKNPGATGFELARAEVDGRLGRTQEAVERCERVMKDHPDDPRAPLQKAALLVGQGQVDEAATVLNEALGRLPGNPAIRVALARLRIVQDDAPEAAAILSAALKIMESRIAAEKAQGRSSEDLRRAQRPLAPIYLELAIAELLAGKPEEALEHAREAGEVDPGRHNQSAQMAAIVWLHKDRPGEALAALDRINTDSGPIPEQAPLIEALARAAAGRPAEALAAFANQTYLNEEVAGLMREMLRARSREQMGRVAPKLAMHLLLSEDSAYPRLALRLAEAALAEVDDDPFLLSRWAEMLLRLGRPEEALRPFERMEQTPARVTALADIYLILADRAQAQGNPKQARAQREKAADHLRTYLEGQPRDAAALTKLATVHQSMGSLATANDHYRRAIEIDSEDWTAYNNLAWNLGQLGAFEEAAQMAREALRLSPGNPGIQDTAGWIELQLGNVEHAVELLSVASRHIPNNSEIRHHLAMAFERSGEAAESARQLETIVLATPGYERIDEVVAMLKKVNPDSSVLSSTGGLAAAEAR